MYKCSSCEQLQKENHTSKYCDFCGSASLEEIDLDSTQNEQEFDPNSVEEIRATLSPWNKKRVVEADSESVRIFKNNGTLLATVPMSEIVGTYMNPVSMASFGTVRFCTNWEDLRGGLMDNSGEDSLLFDKKDVDDLFKVIAFVENQILKYKHKSPYDFEIHGVSSSIYVIDQKIMIKHRGFLSAINRGLVGEKVIPIANLTSIQFKRAAALNGYIQFATAASEATGGAFDATRDENSVLFSKDQEQDFAEFRDRIQAMMDQSKTATPIALAVDPLDQLKKLKELLDAGVLTQEEFDSKKQNLMDKI